MNGKNAFATLFSLVVTAYPLGLAAQPVANATAPWMVTSLTADSRADLVLAEMTREEKVKLVHGYLGVDYPGLPKEYTDAIRQDLPGSAGYVPGIARLGIPALRESDASLGVANGRHMRPGDQATAFASSLLTAASWNAENAYARGAAIGAEARLKGFNVLLGGGINLAREPRCGRIFEYVGEDPLLAGTINGEAIRGTQDQHIISTAKHYALNDQETGRMVMDVKIGDAAMRESDLLAFEIAIERSNPGAIMCSYNRLNGIYACENDYLLNQVLKRDWGYKGFVLSDWGAVHSTVEAAMGGLDQESAFNLDKQDYFGDALRQAVLDGKVSDARLSDMARRILYAMFDNGLIDYPLVKGPIDIEKGAQVAQRDAEEGIVLLKNRRKLLPLSPRTRRIAVIGGRADVGVLSGGGSSQVIPIGNDPSQEFLVGGEVSTTAGGEQQIPTGTIIMHPPAPLAAIREIAPRARVNFADGDDIAKAVALARRSNVAIVFAQQWMREGEDVADLSLHGNQNELIAKVAAANRRTIVVLETGGPVLMPWMGKVRAVLEAWYPGNRGANAIANILFGKVNPSGRLPVTFPRSESQLPRPVIPGYEVANNQNAWLGQPTTPYDVNYTEGANVGYKWFAVQKLKPLFPFGFGLSYTSFAYKGLIATGGQTLIVSFEVRNTGKRQGKTVAQAYATPPGGVMRLIGWSKLDLGPGEKRNVTLAADPRLLASFDSDAHLWRVAEGDYAVTLRSSSADVKARATAHIEASTIKP